MAVKGGLWAGALWTFLLVVSIHDAASQGNSCTREECVSLVKCPQLTKLLRNPTRDNIKTLQDATCYISGDKPMVCCPVTVTPRISLLPRNCGQGYSGIRIHGGEEAPLGAYPWMAIMGYKEIGFDDAIEYLCAGSIINDRYILTAAHCVTQQLFAVKSLEVIGLGDWDLSTDHDFQMTKAGHKFCAPPSQNFTYEEIIIHPQYNKRASHSDDIALIRLSQTIDLTGNWMHPICLPPQGLDVRRVISNENPEAIAAGWGSTENGSSSDRLLHVELPFVDSQACNTTYSGRIVSEQICLGGKAGQDSCGGDSGGPLVVRGPAGPPYLQIGIVSYGPATCGIESIPGVYTYLSHYRTWIEETLRP